MAKFRKRPIVIEAEQWFPGKGVDGVLSKAQRVYGYIQTLEGGHIVDAGDWVITGIKGEKYPCKPDIFEATYERVEE